jgi:DNA-binding CsgD family transcriptional regulator
LKVNSPILPAGLLNDCGEFLVQHNIAYLVYKSQIKLLSKLPDIIKDRIDDAIETDKEAANSLNELRIQDPDERREQFIKCRFGAFDNAPDIIGDQLQHGEYWDCGQRGTCKYEGRLCCTIRSENGTLTKREIEYIKYAAQDLQDKQIADLMGCALNTVVVHKRNVQSKIGAFSKAGIAVFAKEKQLI